VAKNLFYWRRRVTLRIMLQRRMSEVQLLSAARSLISHFAAIRWQCYVSCNYILLVCCCTFTALLLTGCGDKFWDPSQVGRFRPVPAVNVILDSLGVAEETPAAWETGVEPKPADIIAYDTDYVFGPGDVVSISIFELFNEGTMFNTQLVVTETGKISIPDVGVVEAAGLTESQLEEEIKQILSPNIIKEPSVVVTLLQSQSKMFSILGSGVPKPGRYAIPRYDYRLTDALATAGGISQFNISYVYVSRPLTGQEISEEAPTGSLESQAGQIEVNGGQKTSEPQQPDASRINELKDIAEPKEPPDNSGNWNNRPAEPRTDELMEVIAPVAGSKLNPKTAFQKARGNELVISSTEMATHDDISQPDNSSTTRTPGNPSTGGPDGSRIEWIFQDGRWVPLQIGATAPKTPTGSESAAKAFPQAKDRQQTVSWDQIGSGGRNRRVIRVPADKLLSGDPHYNIVIRAGDNIHVPVDIIGEFCIMGNVNSQGFINVTGRPMTLKMAIAAAGGLGPLAWPKKCEVVRRIGTKREEIVMVDLDKIATGEQPDFFIKPNDLINVGTHSTTRFRAVMRNAFRATYGFGFIYDRNFADRDVGTGRPFDFIF
jgi:polysaccharide export outer membrane protein